MAEMTARPPAGVGAGGGGGNIRENNQKAYGGIFDVLL